MNFSSGSQSKGDSIFTSADYFKETNAADIT